MDNLQSQIADQIRVNTAFEQMVSSVLFGASLCGAMFFVLNVLTALIGGHAWFDYFIGVFVNALLYTFIIFLAGFLAAAILITPLFVALEKIPYRRTWPFVAAAVFFEFILYALFFKDFAGAQARPILFNLLMFGPGVVIAVLFGRRMQPFWQAVSRAEQQNPVDFPRLH